MKLLFVIMLRHFPHVKCHHVMSSFFFSAATLFSCAVCHRVIFLMQLFVSHRDTTCWRCCAWNIITTCFRCHAKLFCHVGVSLCYGIMNAWTCVNMVGHFLQVLCVSSCCDTQQVLCVSSCCDTQQVLCVSSCCDTQQVLCVIVLRHIAGVVSHRATTHSRCCVCRRAATHSRCCASSCYDT